MSPSSFRLNDLIGNNGRDILVGNEDEDFLSGGNEDDIIVSGYVSIAATMSTSIFPISEFYSTLRESWTGASVYSERVLRIRVPQSPAPGKIIDLLGANVLSLIPPFTTVIRRNAIHMAELTNWLAVQDWIFSSREHRMPFPTGLPVKCSKLSRLRNRASFQPGMRNVGLKLPGDDYRPAIGSAATSCCVSSRGKPD
jgi:Ca2+-binding RTX toxin-like protein